jgi:peptidoglycan/LPS O-acetylase OafA/YrhL
VSTLPTHGQYVAARRFPALDGLRCLAVLLVVWHHSTPRPPSGLAGRGPFGVDLFFAISGFLITTLLLRERRDSGGVSVARFYARRALRIFPAYYLVLGLYAVHAVFLLPDGPTRAHFLRSVPYWATYTANWFVDFGLGAPISFAFGWSLATEEQFYALWPWLARAPRWFMAAVAVALLASDQGVELGIVGATWPPLAQRMVASIASPICLGALLACALDAGPTFRCLAVLLGHRASAPAMALLLVALVVWFPMPVIFVQGAMALLVAACCVRPDHGLRRWLDSGPLRVVGTLSYSLYLVHVTAIGAAKRLLPGHASDAPLVFVVGLALGLPLAWGLHKLVEVPLMGLRARLRLHGETRVAANVPLADPTNVELPAAVP